MSRDVSVSDNADLAGLLGSSTLSRVNSTLHSLLLSLIQFVEGIALSLNMFLTCLFVVHTERVLD